MGTTRRNFSVASMILAAVASLQLSFVPAYGQGSGTTIKIGALFATSGPGAYQGAQQKEGAELAVEQLNKSGVNGWKFQLYHEDFACAPLPATQAAKRLIETVKPDVIIGESCFRWHARGHAARSAKRDPAHQCQSVITEDHRAWQCVDLPDIPARDYPKR